MILHLSRMRSNVTRIGYNARKNVSASAAFTCRIFFLLHIAFIYIIAHNEYLSDKHIHVLYGNVQA